MSETKVAYQPLEAGSSPIYPSFVGSVAGIQGHAPAPSPSPSSSSSSSSTPSISTSTSSSSSSGATAATPASPLSPRSASVIVAHGVMKEDKRPSEGQAHAHAAVAQPSGDTSGEPVVTPVAAPSGGGGAGVRAWLSAAVVRAAVAAQAYWFRLPEAARRRVFWKGGFLSSLVWTISIMIHASEHTYWNYYTRLPTNSYPAWIMAWTVVTLFAIGWPLGFAIAYNYNHYPICSWCRSRPNPADSDVEGRPASSSSSSRSGSAAPLAPAPASSSDVEGVPNALEEPLFARGSCSFCRVFRAFWVATLPFGIISSFLGTWFGMQLGSLNAVLRQPGVLAGWTFGAGLLAMLIFGAPVMVLSYLDRLAPLLTRADPILGASVNNQGLSPFGRTRAAIYYGMAVSGVAVWPAIFVGFALGVLASLFDGPVGGFGMLVLLVTFALLAVYGVRRYRQYKAGPGAAARAAAAASSSSASAPLAPHSAVELRDVAIDVTVAPPPPSYSPPAAGASAYAAVPLTPTVAAAPTPVVAAAPAPVSEVDMLYLRGLSLMHGDAYGRGKDPVSSAHLIMQAAQLGHAGAQEHVRQLLVGASLSSTTVGSVSSGKTSSAKGDG